jgi:60kDa lysophospholipase
VETFGAGNMPTRKDLLEAFAEASERGVVCNIVSSRLPYALLMARGKVIVNVTQCQKGRVSDRYETGRLFRDVGVVPGHDMTTEVRRINFTSLGCTG